jgi:hypothetical protein
MKPLDNILFLWIGIVLLTACIEKFDPPSVGVNDLLVVDAYLTDDDQPIVVRLSRSIPLDTNYWIPETGADVHISDDSGEEFRLWETDKGIYNYPGNTDPVPGKSYQLHVKTSNGNAYISDWVTMRETPAVDSLTWEYEEIPDQDLQGLQFYVYTHDPENNTWYYRWEWEETWIFYTPYISTINWQDGQIIQRTEDISTCWNTGSSTSIYIASSKNLDQDVVYRYPVYYADNSTDRFSIRYSLNVRQYALSEESYNYWKELKKVTEDLGTLFDPLPSSLHGNIHSIKDENETVLGYFDAYTVQEQRIFISDFELPRISYPDYFRFCEETIVGYDEIKGMINRGLLLIFQTRVGGAVVYMMSTPECIDCTLRGTNIKPDYW